MTLSLETLLNLNHLFIRNCENIKCLSSSKVLPNLVDIEIRECPEFVSFPREGLSAPNLTSLYVSRCLNLKSLPCHANTLLPKLERMTISNFLEMETFPEGGMPPSLRSLYIRNCEKLMRSSSITSMSMLIHLSIGGPCDGVKSFSNGGLVLLPPSLTSLDLFQMSILLTLECRGLFHLPSLEVLRKIDCPKLENMSGERLPASLIQLEIYKCPLLEERCRMKHPQTWPKVAHIRRIEVNYKWIQQD